MKIHIISSGNKWCAKKEGAKRALKVFKYREIAFNYACCLCKVGQDLVIVHNKDGSVHFTF